jgi:hypothetical protein
MPSTTSPSSSEPELKESDPRVTEPELRAMDAAEEVRVDPPKKSNYETRRSDVFLRNIMWALGLTMAVVVVVAILFFGVGKEDDRTVPENSQLDITESAQRAQDQVDFPVVAPDPGEGWSVRSARFSGGEQPRWEVRMSSPDGALVTLVQSDEMSASTLSSAVPGAVVQDETRIEGAECEVLEGDPTGDDAAGAATQAISCEGEGWGFVVHGADAEDVKALAEDAAGQSAETVMG